MGAGVIENFVYEFRTVYGFAPINRTTFCVRSRIIAQ